MPSIKKLLQAAAGNAGGTLGYVEDVFSTYLYTGNSSTQTITNGIDLDGEGGMVWLKQRNASSGHYLQDTDRGANVTLQSNTTAASNTVAGINFSFNSDGWSLNNSYSDMNFSGNDYASWTFRKAEKFFDVVTYTGNGVAGREIAHNLGSVPGCMLVKRTDSSWDWFVWHESLGSSANGDSYLELNTTNPENDGYGKFYWGDGVTYIPPTSSSFTVNAASAVNLSGATYVAYLFASDAGGFGDDGSESIIKCGSYTGNGSTNGPEIDLGFEPQFLITKCSSASDVWSMLDSMRGLNASGAVDPVLFPNLTSSEYSSANLFAVTATGFKLNTTDTAVNGNGREYIYIAIRRPMKTPESATEVFNPFIYTGNNVGGRELGSLSGADSILAASRNTFDSIYPNWQSKLQGNSTRLVTSDNGSEYPSSSYCYSFGNIQDGVTVSGSDMNGSGKTYVAYEFKRAPGFFDVVAYTGDGVFGRSLDHNLGVAPEIIIAKSRSRNSDWRVNLYNVLGATTGAILQSSDAAFNDTSAWASYYPDSSIFKVGSLGDLNASGSTYIAYLFATLAGVSKVGSYTGTGADLNVDCGFSAGARFILIKRSDSTGDWYVYDSVRGIVVGNDPYLLLNTTAAQVTSTDYIDPLASGFTVTSNASGTVNVSGGTYIFLAIA